MTKLPNKVIALAKIVDAAGGRAMLVGGCVRDALMGIEPKDWDLEIYGVASSVANGMTAVSNFVLGVAEK